MLRLATLRSHDQYNTTIYSLDDRYRGVFGGRMVVFMNEADMRARGIADGDEVEIESLAEDGKRRVVGGFWVKPYNHPGRLDRRLLSRDQSAAAARLSRSEERDPRGKVDPRLGSPTAATA